MEIRKIGILHLNQIGDLVFSLPLLRALKENYPASTVHSILRPYLEDLVIHSPDIDKCICRRNGLTNRMTLLKEIRKERYDLLITLSRSEECLLMAALSGAKIKVGFLNFPWDFGLDIKEKIEGHHSWYNNRKLLTRLGIPVKKTDYVGLLVLTSHRGPFGLEEPRIANLPEKYVVISPGTSLRRRVKAWEEEKFGDLIVQLKKRYDLNPVLVGGQDDKEVNEKVIEMVRARDVDKKLNHIENLAGKVGLKDLCYLLKDAVLFVGVDSGIMHLASSFDIPVVGIFGPTDPFYVGPQGSRSTVVREEMACAPCYLKGCKERVCMEKLEASKVLEACERVLQQ